LFKLPFCRKRGRQRRKDLGEKQAFPDHSGKLRVKLKGLKGGRHPCKGGDQGGVGSENVNIRTKRTEPGKGKNHEDTHTLPERPVFKERKGIAKSGSHPKKRMPAAELGYRSTKATKDVRKKDARDVSEWLCRSEEGLLGGNLGKVVKDRILEKDRLSSFLNSRLKRDATHARRKKI